MKTKVEIVIAATVACEATVGALVVAFESSQVAAAPAVAANCSGDR